MKKKVIKLKNADISRMVDKILAEDSKKTKVVKEQRRTEPVSRMMDSPESIQKYSRGTRWCSAHLDKYGPIKVYITADDVKVAELEGQFYSQDDRVISREEAEEIIGCQLDQVGPEGLRESKKSKKKIIRLTESQMVEFLERTAKRVKAAKQRRAK